MLRAITLTLLCGSALFAQVQFTTSPNLRGIPVEDASSKRFILPGDTVVPQIANGTLEGGQFFFMIFEFMNITNGMASMELRFFDSNGDPMALPIAQGKEKGTGSFIGVGGTFTPGQGGVTVTSPVDAPVQIGYATLSSMPSESVAVLGIFNNQVPGSRMFQASVPMETRLHDKMFMPYLNTGGFVSSLAVVAGLAQNLTLIARDYLGVELCRTTKALALGEHYPFLIRDRLPCTVDREGILEVQGQFGLSGIGFFAADEGLGAFVTLPVYGVLPAL
jgi:hypothetical protein